MIYTTITANIIDQTMQLSNLPLLASGSVGVVKIECHFCERWEGYAKVGVFYVKPEEVFHIPLDGDVVTVPAEVLASAGGFFFGIAGVLGDTTRTTEELKLTIVKGAITTATSNPAEPTPDLYGQLLSSWAISNARINQIVKMGSGQGAIVHTLSDEYISGGRIVSNGTSAYIHFDLVGMSLIAGGYHYSDYCIIPALAPLGPIELKCSNPDLNVTLLAAEESGWARLLIENASSNYYDTDMVTSCEAYYPLASVSIAELADARVGHDGHEYETAGEAVREQVRALSPGGSGGAPDPAIYTQLLAAYNELVVKVALAESNSQQALDAVNAGFLPVSGGALTGGVTLNGVYLTEGEDFGDTVPEYLPEGKLFFVKVVGE